MDRSPFDYVKPSLYQAESLGFPRGFGQAAARLTPEEPFAEQPIQGDDATYIIELQRKIPSEVPPLDSIRDRVTQDYVNSRALDMARAAGKDLQTAITNAMAQGKTFDAAVAEKNASPINLSPFSRRTQSLPDIPNSGDTSQLVTKAFSLSPGKVSDFVPTRAGGFVVYVKAVDPVPEATVKAELPEFTKTLERQRQYQAFMEWFRTQESLAKINLPGDKRASLR